MVMPTTVSPTVFPSELPGSDMERRFIRMLRAETDRSPCHRYKELLRRAGLRPTHQRMALGAILFSNGNRHLTAEMLFAEATKAKISVSLATVYNTLHQFTEAGLLRQIGVGAKSFFDTNLSEHHHFFIQGEDALLDIPPTEALLDKLPQPPEGYEITRVDVVARLRRKRG